MDVQTVLTWIVGGGGAGVLSYALIEEFGSGLTSRAKRYLAIVLTALLGAGAYAASVWLGYVPAPETAQGWVEALAPVAFTAFGLSQIIHGERQLR